MFELVVETRGGVAILRPRGNLFLPESEQLEERAEGLLRAGYERYVVNLGGADYIGSSGIGAMASLHKRIAKLGGRLVFTDVPEKAIEVLHIMGLEMLELMDTEAEALASLGSDNAGGGEGEALP